jgi:hypothetical protein
LNNIFSKVIEFGGEYSDELVDPPFRDNTWEFLWQEEQVRLYPGYNGRKILNKLAYLMGDEREQNDEQVKKYRQEEKKNEVDPCFSTDIETT